MNSLSPDVLFLAYSGAQEEIFGENENDVKCQFLKNRVNLGQPKLSVLIEIYAFTPFLQVGRPSNSIWVIMDFKVPFPTANLLLAAKMRRSAIMFLLWQSALCIHHFRTSRGSASIL